MESNKRPENVYSTKMRAGRRTYFFDVRKTKGEDFYISISESTKKVNGEGYDKHMIFLYKEDFNRFVECLQTAVNEVKTNFLPDFNYDYVEPSPPISAENENKTEDEEKSKEEDHLSW
ncbi:MAG: DUF3276 family protein [Saprospiraceae bacterium]